MSLGNQGQKEADKKTVCNKCNSMYTIVLHITSC